MEEIGRTFSVRVPNTVVGSGAVSGLAGLVRGLGATSPLLVTDRGVVQAGLLEPVKNTLENAGISFLMFDRCEPDAPLNVVQECAKFAQENGCDLLIALGGGSVMDTAKVASFLAMSEKGAHDLLSFGHPMQAGLPKLPNILIPTTAGSGSEWSGAAVVTDYLDGQKRSIWNGWADAVVIDPVMTSNLPCRITADTGMDALSHGIEAYTSWKANVVSDMFAEKTIGLVAENLPIAFSRGARQAEARYKLAVAAALGMQAGSAAGLSVAHPMSYAVATKAYLPHGRAVCLLLPRVMEFNLLGNPGKFARIANLMGEETKGLSMMEAAHKSINAVRDLSRDMGMPERMRDVGIKKDDIPGFVDFLFEVFPIGLEINPRDMTRGDAAAIYEAAW